MARPISNDLVLFQSATSVEWSYFRHPDQVLLILVHRYTGNVLIFSAKLRTVTTLADGKYLKNRNFAIGNSDNFGWVAANCINTNAVIWWHTAVERRKTTSISRFFITKWKSKPERLCAQAYFATSKLQHGTHITESSVFRSNRPVCRCACIFSTWNRYLCFLPLDIRHTECRCWLLILSPPLCDSRRQNKLTGKEQTIAASTT